MAARTIAVQGRLWVCEASAEVPAGGGLLQGVVDGSPPLAAPHGLLPSTALEDHQVTC